MTVYIVPYAYGFNPKTCEPDYVCRLRTDAALRALKKNPDSYIVLGAGMADVTDGCGALANMMEHTLLEVGINSEKILRNPKGRDTLSETEAAYETILKRGDENKKIVCATSAFHHTRVQLIWFARFQIWPEMFSSTLPTSREEKIHEFLKIPRDIVRAVFKRLLSV